MDGVISALHCRCILSLNLQLKACTAVSLSSIAIITTSLPGAAMAGRICSLGGKLVGWQVGCLVETVKAPDLLIVTCNRIHVRTLTATIPGLLYSSGLDCFTILVNWH